MIFTRYSYYLDSQWTGRGWNYSVPSPPYNEVNKDSEDNMRLQPSLAMFYKDRNDKKSIEKIYTAIINAFRDLPQRQVNAIPLRGKIVPTRSFNEMIGMYLALNLIKFRPEIFTVQEKNDIVKNIKEMYAWALEADDTENRAFIGAAYGTAVLLHPLANFSMDEKKKYFEIIKKKVSVGLESVDKNYLYTEGAENEFSLHYHLVSASMLYFIGLHINDTNLVNISKKMFRVVHNAYVRGEFGWDGSGRPRGIGLQTVFMRALGEKILGNAGWKEYWDTEKQGLGFIDVKNPGRLVWQDMVDGEYNDDYSFANIVELLLEAT